MGRGGLQPQPGQARFSFPRAVVVGGLAGIFGGWAFGKWMAQVDFFPLIAGLINADAPRVGVTLHFIYALLSDEGRKVIRELGLLSDLVDEQHAAYGIPEQDRHRGLPYPGVFPLDEQGRVMQKRFQQSYRERETGVGIPAQGFSVTSSVHGPEAHGQSQRVKVCAYLDTDTYQFFQRLWLTVELTIEPGVHVYARPIPEGYIPLSLAVAPIAG